jgi:hypothetical protein
MTASFVPMSFPATELTPGVARSETRDQVCRSSEGKNRAVPAALRRQVFALYGMPATDPKAYEVDYLITPALGGANDIGNLWPQSYSSTMWNARVKDALEDRLHELVRSGDVDLRTAQREIFHGLDRGLQEVLPHRQAAQLKSSGQFLFLYRFVPDPCFLMLLTASPTF